jgi:hypothetical protein
MSHRGCCRVAWCRRPWGVVLFLGWSSCSVRDRYSWVGDHCPWMGVVEGVEGREEGGEEVEGREWRRG